jgi:hypothetical protein
VPILSRFFGIIITMNYREHGPPHFHAWYSGEEITVEISDGSVNGDMRRRAVALVLEWWNLHRDELATNWQLAQSGQPLKMIEPLDYGVAMHFTVVEARYVRDYVIWVRFKDGSEGEVDLAAELWGPVFEPLKDLSYFRQFAVAEYGTIAWPNGADVAPEFLYEKARVVA